MPQKSNGDEPMWQVIFSKQAFKDLQKIKSAGLSPKVHRLVDLLADNPYATPPSYEKLTGNLNGMYSRRINIQHRLVYTIDEDTRTIHILRTWTHYE